MSAEIKPDFAGLGLLRVGYAIGPGDLEHPAFRRRFAYYAKERGLRWELADWNKPYDVVVVHHSSDLPRWSQYRRGKLIFDYNDDYLAVGMGSLKGRFRGAAKFCLGQWSRFHWDFRTAYHEISRRADAIVCATETQAVMFRSFSPVVEKIVDMQSDEGWTPKSDYASGGTTNLVWEGLPDFDGLATFAPAYRKISAEGDFSLHVLSSVSAARYLSKYGRTSTYRLLGKKLGHTPRTFLYEWNKYLYSKIVTACDLAIIPANMQDPYWMGKPANKLLFFWRLGLPVLTSPTPEYRIAMNECGLDMTCGSAEEWVEKIGRYSRDSDLRKSAGLTARHYVESNYSNEKLLQKWDRLLQAVAG